MKLCKKCSGTFPLESFYPNRATCKSCYIQAGYVWKQQNKETWLAIVAKSKNKNYKQNPTPVLLRNQEWRSQNKEYVKDLNFRYRKENPDIIAKNRKLRHSSFKDRCVSWADQEKIKTIYKQARLENKEVDHIIPLQGKYVSGLHVENNLQLLSRTENRKKSNTYEYHTAEH